jgi:hypothetical protein
MDAQAKEIKNKVMCENNSFVEKNQNENCLIQQLK